MQFSHDEPVDVLQALHDDDAMARANVDLDMSSSGSAPLPNYRPDPTSGALLTQTATTLGGAVVSVSEVTKAVADARKFLGVGPVEKVSETARFALMPYVTLAVFFPLGFLLWRRNA